MTKAGFDSIEKGKQNGSWTILEGAEGRFIPEDLECEFSKRPNAKQYFLGLSRSDKRDILQWLVLAEKSKTRQKRIHEIEELADQQLKPKQFR